VMGTRSMAWEWSGVVTLTAPKEDAATIRENRAGTAHGADHSHA